MKNNSFGFEQQMEMSFERAWEPTPNRPRRQTRHHRAAWWFTQMRMAVERAWAPESPEARPEQTYMTFPGRKSSH